MKKDLHFRPATSAVYFLLFFVFLMSSSFSSAQADCAQLPEGGVAWWKFDEQAGPIAYDSLNMNHGTYRNGPVPGRGLVQLGLFFDGIDDYVEVAGDSSLDIGTGDFSVDVWVKATSPFNDVQTIIDKMKIADGGSGFSLSLYEGNAIHFAWGDGSGFTSAYAQGFTFDNTWTHIAVSVDRDSVTGGLIYVNGTPVLTFDPTLKPGSLTNDRALHIGQGEVGDGSHFKGAIDELRLYNRAILPSEVSEIYAAKTEGVCLSGFSCGTVQSYDRNLRKYWRYRDRFDNGFIVQGENCANGLPIADRGDERVTNPNVRFGDAVIDMGYYLGGLATEYKLLEDNGQSTDETELALYYALQELIRLDAYAESAWTHYLATGELNFCAAPANLNGFLLRDDHDDNFVETHSLELNSELGRLYNVFAKSTVPRDIPTEISQDQIASLLTGLALISKLVDPDANYAGFRFVQETKSFTTRVFNWIKSGSWVINNPVRNACVFGIAEECWDNPPDPVIEPSRYANCCQKGGAIMVPLSFGYAEAANKIVHGFTPGVGLGPFHDIVSLSSRLAWQFSSLVWAPPAWQGTDFVLAAAAVGDSIHDGPINLTVPRLNAKAIESNREYLPLVHHVLYSRGYFVPHDKIECLLDSAPCAGPMGRPYGASAGPYEWSTPNRFKIVKGERRDARVIDQCREYYGLDYMLLYNLYKLSNPSYGPAYERLKLPMQAPCDYCSSTNDEPSIDCDCLSAAGTVRTCKKSCRVHKRECKEVCRSVKGECKTTCKSEKETCLSGCDSLSGRAKRQCRRGCRSDKRECKTECREDKRFCKTECKDEFSDCRTVCTTGSDPQKRQYCIDSAKPKLFGIYRCQ